MTVQVQHDDRRQGVGTNLARVIRYNRALDGLRALSVIAVVLYHAGALSGGWIGVEVFFIISGYLITSLLLAEHERTGTIAMLAFWRRRARRLLPGIVLLACIAAAYYAYFEPSRPNTSATRDMVGLLTYSSNWTTITGTGYWESFNAPSPLRHAWSLAVEEQFYLVFPLIAAGLMRRQIFHKGIYVLTIAAVAWQVIASRIYDVDRVYLGTDTRMFGLFAGASLALYVGVRDKRLLADGVLGDGVRADGVRERRSTSLELVGWVALAGLAIATLALEDATASTFAGPFQLVVLASVAMLVSLHSRPAPSPTPSATTPSEPSQSMCARMLSVEPLAAVGRWSYGIYLFHWPLLIALEPGVPDRPWLTSVVVLALTIPLAACSYRWFEQPVRRHGLLAFGGRPFSSILGAAGAAAAAVALLIAVTTNAAALPTVAEIAARAAPSPAVTTVPGTSPATSPATVSGTTSGTVPGSMPDTVPVVEGTAAPPVADSPIIYSSPEEVSGRVPSTIAPTTPDDQVGSAAEVDDQVVRPAQRPFRLYIVGDSVGDSIDRMLQPLSGDLDVEVFSRAVPSCGYDRELQQHFNQDFEPATCLDVIEQWSSDVATFRPDAVLFAYGAWWGWFRNGSIQTQCEPDLADHVRGLYELALADLGSSGAPVYFMAPPNWDGAQLGPEGTPAYFDCLREVMHSWADNADGDARIADVYSLLCTGDDCSSTVDGVPTRPDGVHFHGAAAPAVMTALIDEITDPPAGGWPDFGEIVLPQR